MDDTQPQPLTGTRPSSPAASAPPRSGLTLRGRRWAYGATLAAAGVLAGSGVTYAVVAADATAPAVQSVTQQGAPMGAPPQVGEPDGGSPGSGSSATEGAAT